jgi:predicted enzyme related to lactoylglutathione lyase
MKRPLFRKLDNLLLRVSDLDAAIAFYRDGLGHALLWRDKDAAGFALPDTDAELVVHLRIGPETDILVENADDAFAAFLNAGGEVIVPPFDIRIGRCARVRDPFGNVLVILDQSKGKLTTSPDGYVTGVESRVRRA